MENSPKHMVSTAQIMALCSGGGTSAVEETRNPTNFGGGKSSIVPMSCMEEIAGWRSGSLVTEESESFKTAADKRTGCESTESPESHGDWSSSCCVRRDSVDGHSSWHVLASKHGEWRCVESARGMKLDNVVALPRWWVGRRRDGCTVIGVMASSSSVCGPGLGSTSPSSSNEICGSRSTHE